MIECKKCGRTNEDHYKFCLGCGARLADQKAAAAPKSVPIPAPLPEPSSLPEPVQTAPAGPPRRDALKDDATVVRVLPPEAEFRSCHACNHQISIFDQFCGKCGTRVEPPSSGPSTQRTDASPAPKAELVLIRADGTEGQRHNLQEGDNVVGREIPVFGEDRYISPQHARVRFSGGRVTIRDTGSLNGVFVRIKRSCNLKDGDRLRVGLELMEFRTAKPSKASTDGTRVQGSPSSPLWGRLLRINGKDSYEEAYPLQNPEVFLGRDRGDITFPGDAFVSGRHARVYQSSEGYSLEDLNSSNGTYLKVEEQELEDGDVLLLGQQIVRLSLRETP